MILSTLCHYNIWLVKNLYRIYNKKYSQKMNVWWKKDRFRSDKCFYRDGITTISVFNVMRFFRNSLYVTIPKTKLPKSHSLSPFFRKSQKRPAFYFVTFILLNRRRNMLFMASINPAKLVTFAKQWHILRLFLFYIVMMFNYTNIITCQNCISNLSFF